MSTHHHAPSEVDSSGTDSVASSPRYTIIHPAHDPRLRFMCSFGGKILPRPHDNQLRYVGGETRIVAVHRGANFAVFVSKLSKLSGIPNVSVKYQLPYEDLDSLVSVTTEEDMENMMEEYDRGAYTNQMRSNRFRLFLFPRGEDASRACAITSLLGGSPKRESWFLDTLKSGTRDCARSECSSVLSEVPDYLFGLDNSDETTPNFKDSKKTRPPFHESLTPSDPGSPAPVAPSPFCSTSSVALTVSSFPGQSPVDVKPDASELFPLRYPHNPSVQYVSGSHFSTGPSLPVYYIPSMAVQPNVLPVPAVHIRGLQRFEPPRNQMPVIYHQAVPGMGQLYGGTPPVGMDPYDSGRVGLTPDLMNHSVFYGVGNQTAALPVQDCEIRRRNDPKM